MLFIQSAIVTSDVIAQMEFTNELEEKVVYLWQENKRLYQSGDSGLQGRIRPLTFTLKAI